MERDFIIYFSDMNLETISRHILLKKMFYQLNLQTIWLVPVIFS